MVAVPEAILADLHGPVGRADRAAVALELDRYAYPLATAMTARLRPAMLALGAIHKTRAYRRIGYRTQSVYAKEELGMSGRTFRARAKLEERLERLPEIQRAYRAGEIPWTKADVIAAIATQHDEAMWLKRARNETVRALKAAGREARQRAHRSESTDATLAPGATLATESGGAEPSQDEPSGERCALTMPPWALGRSEANQVLTRQVAGANLPPGTCLEMLAAEFISGAEADLVGNDPAANELAINELATGEAGLAFPSPLPAQGLGDRSVGSSLPGCPSSETPEDPYGIEAWLERRTGCWRFLTQRPWRKGVASTAGEPPGAQEPKAESSSTDDPSADESTDRPLEGAEKARAIFLELADIDEELAECHNETRLHGKLTEDLRKEQELAFQLG